MPPSTILLAAARHCGSSSLWLLTAASGGGVVRRARQVKHMVGGCGGEKGGLLGFPLRCLLSAHSEMSAVVQEGGRFSPVRALFFTVSTLLHLSHSMGFIFDDGGGSERTKGQPPPLVPSNTLKETLRDVQSPFDNHRIFLFPTLLFSPNSLPSLSLISQSCWENIAGLNLTFLTDDLVNK